MTEPSVVAVSRAGTVGVIELARPEKFNCLSLAVFAAISAAVDAFETPESGVRSIMICAQGKNFCTGADLDEVLSLRQDIGEMRRFISTAHQTMKRLSTSSLPVVAACQGLSLAGGFELMLACDIAIAARDARFGDQHAQYGLLPGFGASQRIPRLIGLRRSMDLFFSARWLDAQTAQQWGLVNRVVEAGELRQAALDYCEELATRSRIGLATMKRLAREGLEGSLEAGLKLEEEVVSGGLLEEDVSEGLAAFQERRSPRFRS
ncbi:enoyl-CoA hydratase/isomerase family protein [Paraburkholderia dioscoreae]|uniref:Enoyl-CoA hydratase/carnithine racemase n=1 Tax=Paraburkholderia dioscoreae TaxID=2604047 RepID=A0A5Q4ZB76_9BURK|nr:enoyl-CoA hydratase/isomerase family protein [Paraburkholderia dioscoreae]VVD28221.1 Enoyl-CoA hydratase/carnithine racemase [Paraburkholderia dioscoreae]